VRRLSSVLLGQGLAAGPLLGENVGGCGSRAGILTDTHTGKGDRRRRARDHSLHGHAAVDKPRHSAQGLAAQRKSIHPVWRRCTVGIRRGESRRPWHRIAVVQTDSASVPFGPHCKGIARAPWGWNESALSFKYHLLEPTRWSLESRDKSDSIFCWEHSCSTERLLRCPHCRTGYDSSTRNSGKETCCPRRPQGGYGRQTDDEAHRL